MRNRGPFCHSKPKILCDGGTGATFPVGCRAHPNAHGRPHVGCQVCSGSWSSLGAVEEWLDWFEGWAIGVESWPSRDWLEDVARTGAK